MVEASLKVKEEHLCIISDLHLGNPIFFRNNSLKNFLRYLSRNGISLCINGDGLDLLQFSPGKFVKDIKSTFKSLKEFILNGRNEIYYILGNHDLFMKNILEETGIFAVAPSLEVRSGDKRIYIEHGHFHDYLFQNYQKIYIKTARFLGKILKTCPELFHAYFKIESFVDWFLAGLKNRRFQKLDKPKYLEAAREILARGFDIVVFGHSHRHGLHVLEDGKIFANAGAWTSRRSHFLEIFRGAITLKEWR